MWVSPAFLAFCVWTLPTIADAAPPNILMILSDDHSYPFLSCYGNRNVRTPSIDSLAAGGMKFHRFFTGAPQCVPSRATLMTGRSPVAARMTRFSSPLPRDEIAFPEVLRQKAGYFTGVCGRSYHLDGSSRNADTVIGRLTEKHRMRSFQDRMDFVRQGSDAQAIEQASEFLGRKPADKPFFLWVNFSDPHHAWNAAQSDQPAPESLQLPAHWPDLPGVRQQVADYMAEINRLDRSVQALLELLAARGFEQNTLVVFAGDNGAALPHGKGSLYDPGCNVPFIIRWPGVVAPGTESRELVSGEDLGPTLLAAAGVEIPSRMTGTSILPLLKNEAHTARKYVFTERGPHGTTPVSVNIRNASYDLSRAVRSDRYKLIYNCTPWIPYAPVDSAGGQAWQEMAAAHDAGKLAAGVSATYFTTPRPVYEFYDLDADPAELHNLSGQSAVADIEREMRIALTEKMILDFDYLPLPDVGDSVANQKGKNVGKGKNKKKSPAL